MRVCETSAALRRGFRPHFSYCFVARRGEELFPRPERIEAKRTFGAGRRCEATSTWTERGEVNGDCLLAEQPAGRQRRQVAAEAV